MTSTILNRREFSVRVASLLPALGIAGTALGASSRLSGNAAPQEISHSAEAIHQEVPFKASRKRVYEALTDAKQFTQVTELSPVKNAPPADISPNVGGTFSCFGGVIVGRHVELVPNERIVQAWRVSYWGPGIYSIARVRPQGRSWRNKNCLWPHRLPKRRSGESLVRVERTLLGPSPEILGRLELAPATGPHI